MVERPTLAGPALQSNKRVAGNVYSGRWGKAAVDYEWG